MNLFDNVLLLVFIFYIALVIVVAIYVTPIKMGCQQYPDYPAVTQLDGHYRYRDCVTEAFWEDGVSHDV